MTSKKRTLYYLARLCLTGAFWTAWLPTVQAVDAPGDSVETALLAMEGAAGAPVAVTHSPLTDLVSFVAANRGHPLRLDVPASAPPSERALAFLGAYGKAFGIKDPSKVRVLRATPKDQVGMEHVRLQQLHEGIPVTAGELTVHLRGASVVSVLAKTLPDPADVETTPEIGGGEAGAIVSQLLREKRFIQDAAISTPRLEILNKGLLEGVSSPSRLAWFLVASKVDLREYFWVDAKRGAILLNFSQRPDALNRQIHDTASSNVLPGPLVRSEGGPPTGDPDADRAYDFSGDTYNYFFNEHGRDSFDGSGATILSTVHFCPSPAECPSPSAFWNGVQMVYGEGFSLADDVDAHELTHAVTEFSANLFYYMQSGALNESFSDIFGETVDLTNAGGTDSPAVRWVVGEDLPGLGAIRNMMNPNAFGNPGKVSDPEFLCVPDSFDQGGVHSNSGVPNHAYALMVDGGVFNGRTVTGIGLTKAGKIQYRTLTSYLTTGSNFLDNYRALLQSCNDLIGTAGITATDCGEVKDALDAVEMSQAICAIPGEPELCPAGHTRTDLFFDSLEAGFGNFVTQTPVGSNSWSRQSFFAKTGVFYLDNFPQTAGITDSSVAMNLSIAIPAGARMQFSHVWEFERDPACSPSTFCDGAVVELSSNGGASWRDAGSLIVAGAPYNGTISSGFGNPLAGRAAFGGASFGYTASQLDLTSLAGKNARFRFRFGADNSVFSFGSGVDDVRIYQCAGPPPPVTCNGLPATIVGTGVADTLTGTPGNDVIHGLGGNDIITGGGGNDVMCGGSGRDRLSGNQSRDRLFGGTGKDVLRGGADNDRLFGQSGNDAMNGQSGSDRCKGGSGNDTAASCERTTSLP